MRKQITEKMNLDSNYDERDESKCKFEIGDKVICYGKHSGTISGIKKSIYFDKPWLVLLSDSSAWWVNEDFVEKENRDGEN